MGRGKLVAILGPVGVGKSTIIRYLAIYLKLRGYKVIRIFVKSYHGPSYVIWAAMSRLLRLSKKYAPWFIVPRAGYARTAKVLVTFSAWADLLIAFPIKLLKIKAFKVVGYVVLSEEYLHVAILDYIYSKKDLHADNPFLTTAIRLMWTLASRYNPDVTFILTACTKDLLIRWMTRGFGDPQSRYVALQMPAYRVLLKRASNVVVLDTCGAKALESVKRIVERLELDASQAL